MSGGRNLTILDVGNTHVRIFESAQKDSFILLRCLPTAVFMEQLEQWVPDPARTAAASVVPALTARLGALGVFMVSPKAPLPFHAGTLDLSSVGADRLANAAQLTDGVLPAVCIDCGTAITFEVVSAEKEFLGGAILPGRMLMRQALHDHTAQLPLIDLYDSLPAVPGANTVDAMRIGTDLAAVGAVREILSSLRKRFPSGLRQVVCGGDRHFFLNALELEDGGDDFTLRGIRKILECRA